MSQAISNIFLNFSVSKKNKQNFPLYDSVLYSSLLSHILPSVMAAVSSSLFSIQICRCLGAVCGTLRLECLVISSAD